MLRKVLSSSLEVIVSKECPERVLKQHCGQLFGYGEDRTTREDVKYQWSHIALGSMVYGSLLAPERRP